MIRSALLVSLILQALRLSLAAAPAAEIAPTAIPAPILVAPAETDCDYDLPQDGSADALEIRRALNCWKSLGRPGDIFCPPGYGRFFNTSECWLRVYRFETPSTPTPVPYPAPYP